MAEAIIITPVKNAIENTLQTIRAISLSQVNIRHVIFNDFSSLETKIALEENKVLYGYDLVHLEDLTRHPSPNYKLVLIESQKMALRDGLPLIIVESDVEVQADTFQKMLALQRENKQLGLIAAITIGIDGKINFPYLRFRTSKNSRTNLYTRKSLSFCCTMLTPELLENYDLANLSNSKDWFDTFLSDQSEKLGFRNVLMTGTRVIHKPHGSRPWKQLKYTNPIKYYWLKITQKRDRI